MIPPGNFLRNFSMSMKDRLFNGVGSTDHTINENRSKNCPPFAKGMPSNGLVFIDLDEIQLLQGLDELQTIDGFADVAYCVDRL